MQHNILFFTFAKFECFLLHFLLWLAYFLQHMSAKFIYISFELIKIDFKNRKIITFAEIMKKKIQRV